MAAGLGTRLRPLTYEVPKPLVPVANRPVIEHILRGLAAGGFGEVVANLHWFADAVRETLGDGSNAGVELTFRYEERAPRHRRRGPERCRLSDGRRRVVRSDGG